FYKIAGTWGNHEGSLLLWINILVLITRTREIRIFFHPFQSIMWIVLASVILSNLIQLLKTTWTLILRVLFR
ncbi:MAG: hypothetical protein ACKVJK_09375, partial [Methylophagaceae bacterium]